MSFIKDQVRAHTNAFIKSLIIKTIIGTIIGLIVGYLLWFIYDKIPKSSFVIPESIYGAPLQYLVNCAIVGAIIFILKKK